MQTRKESTRETILNVGSGFLLALLLWQYAVGPLYDAGYLNALGITTIFTAISVARGYMWRRLSNKKATACMAPPDTKNLAADLIACRFTGDNAEFRQFIAPFPAQTWAKKDLSAVRFGWDGFQRTHYHKRN